MIYLVSKYLCISVGVVFTDGVSLSVHKLCDDRSNWSDYKPKVERVLGVNSDGKGTRHSLIHGFDNGLVESWCVDPVQEHYFDQITVEMASFFIFLPCQLYCLLLCDTLSSFNRSGVCSSSHKSDFSSFYHDQAALCLSLFLSHRLISLWIPSKVLMTSWNSGVVEKRSHRAWVVKDIEMQLIFYTRPAPSSQSGSTSHLLSSPSAFGVFLYCRLNPSAMLVTPRMCCMSTILCASTPSLHLVCVAESLSFIRHCGVLGSPFWPRLGTRTQCPKICQRNISGLQIQVGRVYTFLLTLMFFLKQRRWGVSVLLGYQIRSI